MNQLHLSALLSFVSITAATYNGYGNRAPSRMNFDYNKSMSKKDTLAPTVDLSMTVDELSNMGTLLKKINYGKSTMDNIPQIVNDDNREPTTQYGNFDNQQLSQGISEHQKIPDDVGQLHTLTKSQGMTMGSDTQQVQPHNQPTYGGAQSQTSFQHVQASQAQPLNSPQNSQAGKADSQRTAQQVQTSYNQPSYVATYPQISHQQLQSNNEQSMYDQGSPSTSKKNDHDQSFTSASSSLSRRNQLNLALDETTYGRVLSEQFPSDLSHICSQQRRIRPPQTQSHDVLGVNGYVSSRKAPKFIPVLDQTTFGQILPQETVQQVQYSNDVALYGQSSSQANTGGTRIPYEQKVNGKKNSQATPESFVYSSEQPAYIQGNSQVTWQQLQTYPHRPNYGQTSKERITQQIKPFNDDMLTGNMESTAARSSSSYGQNQYIN